MHIQTQFSVFLINKPGVLASITLALAKAKINITALALMDSGEHGALRLVCDDTAKAREVLAKVHDRCTESEVLSMELDNRPGAFARVAKLLADEHVNITYAYSSSGAAGGRTTAIFKVAGPDMDKAIKIVESALVEKTEKRANRTTPPQRRNG